MKCQQCGRPAVYLPHGERGVALCLACFSEQTWRLFISGEAHIYRPPQPTLSSTPARQRRKD